MHTPEKHYTIREVASLLAVSDKTVRRLIDSERLDAARVGRVLRIPGSAINNLTEANTRTHSPNPLGRSVRPRHGKEPFSWQK